MVSKSDPPCYYQLLPAVAQPIHNMHTAFQKPVPAQVVPVPIICASSSGEMRPQFSKPTCEYEALIHTHTSDQGITRVMYHGQQNPTREDTSDTLYVAPSVRQSRRFSRSILSTLAPTSSPTITFHHRRHPRMPSREVRAWEGRKVSAHATVSRGNGAAVAELCVDVAGSSCSVLLGNGGISCFCGVLLGDDGMAVFFCGTLLFDGGSAFFSTMTKRSASLVSPKTDRRMVASVSPA